MRAPTAALRSFAPFRLDSSNGQLWGASKEIRLRRKTFAVLQYLVDHAGQLVTKAQLLDAVWPDVSVSDSMPPTSVCELRKWLGGSTGRPRFIETVQGRGYRFIAAISAEESGQTPGQDVAGTLARTTRAWTSPFVGRAKERGELRAALAETLGGHKRLALISGEPGIGKSRLCAELAADATDAGMVVMIGRCSEQGAVPLLAFVEILERCVESTNGEQDL